MKDNINIALDFIDTCGDRITCIQLLNDDKKAIIDASFNNKKITRNYYINEELNKEFLKTCQELMETIEPVSFT